MKEKRHHSWWKDGNIDLADKDTLVWAVCRYLRVRLPDGQDECKFCPDWEDDKIHGPRKAGCRLMAEEVINICQTGNPWRKP